MREFACRTTVILAQPRVSRLRVAVSDVFRRASAGEIAGLFCATLTQILLLGVATLARFGHSKKIRVGMALIWNPQEPESRRFVASVSPRSHGLAILKIPRGDGANLESPRATVTQIRGPDIATLAPFGHSGACLAVLRLGGLPD